MQKSSRYSKIIMQLTVNPERLKRFINTFIKNNNLNIDNIKEQELKKLIVSLRNEENIESEIFEEFISKMK